MDTREAILALRMIVEKRLNMNKITYIRIIDLEKSFNTINWNLMITTLKKTGLDWRDRKIVMELYGTLKWLTGFPQSVNHLLI